MVEVRAELDVFMRFGRGPSVAPRSRLVWLRWGPPKRKISAMKRSMPLVIVGMVIALCASASGAVDRVSHDRSCSATGPESNRSVADARRFHRFPLFFAGRTLGPHLPLTGVVCDQAPVADAPVIYKPPSSYGTIPSWTFIYGDCTPASGIGAGGCGPPVQITSDGSCWNNLGLYFKRDRPKLIHLRGVPVGLFPESDNTHIELYTKQTTITIFASTIPKAKRIARALRSADGRYPSGSRLRPASLRTLAGKVRCADVARGPVQG